MKKLLALLLITLNAHGFSDVEMKKRLELTAVGKLMSEKSDYIRELRAKAARLFREEYDEVVAEYLKEKNITQISPEDSEKIRIFLKEPMTTFLTSIAQEYDGGELKNSIVEGLFDLPRAKFHEPRLLILQSIFELELLYSYGQRYESIIKELVVIHNTTGANHVS